MEFNELQSKTLETARDLILTAYPSVLAVYVFGSFGTKFEREGSDLDLAILADEPIPADKLWRVAQEIAIALNRDVDLVNLRSASTVFQNQIVTTGNRFYCSDTKKCDAIENTYMSMYLRFNEERAQILNDKKGLKNG